MKKIYVAGHNGMVGSAIAKILGELPNVILLTRPRSSLDLLNQEQVSNFFAEEKPEEVIIAAAKVGGIEANNTNPADFIYQNLQIQNNLIHSAHINGIDKLLFLGSSCIYPKFADQPIFEEQLLTGKLEATNEPYAIAKIAGIKMCESYNRQYGRDYRSVMPTNLYGEGDNYHPSNSHVVPGLLRRFHEAKMSKTDSVIVWGTGTPKREFLYVEDMASASLMIHNLSKKFYTDITKPSQSHINIGSGIDISISDLAVLIKKVVGFKGKIIFDKDKPDGTPRKLLDVSILNKLGWKPKYSLEHGLRCAYSDFLLRNN